ncbi:MAG TPA: VWA domain-containing protein [Verrucomicrobiae bacterium]|nr:VWA domain-containing protein [Verrucomicrobiae bacterium]
MQFAHPQLLWLLLVIPPALALFFWWREQSRQKLLTRFVQARLLSALLAGTSPARRKIRFGFVILAVALLMVALARLQYGFDLQKVEQRGLDIVVAIDTSKSMLADDIAPNRLERAKLAALDLMQQAKADRLGLVAFAGDTFLECPLTIDDTAFRQSVEALNVNTIPQGGTALASAINAALTTFKEGDHYKVLVLLTDGEDNVNSDGALAAAKDAAKAGLKIFTVGIGTADGTLLRITDANGNSDYIRDPAGNVVKSHLNEALLQEIARAAGGFYLPLRPNTMDTLYEKGIAPLPESESQERLVRRYHEQFRWPLLAAICLLLGEMFLPERKRERTVAHNDRPHPGPLPQEREKRPPVLIATGVTVLFALLGLANNGFASPASALREYNAGNYTNALREFERLAEANTNDLRLVFNAGTAAYRATNYVAALNDFQTAALSPDLELQQRAYYNLGNTLYRQGELKFEPDTEGLDAMEQTWQQAVRNYEHAAELDTNDVDAVGNLAFVKRQIGLIAQLREAMRRAKLAADDAVRRNEYHRALEIMESLNSPIAARKFQDYIKKLKDIDEIVTPSR